MAYIRIFLLGLATCLLPILSSAQGRDNVTILDHLQKLDETHYIKDNSKKVLYVLISDRNCSKCFAPICSLVEKSSKYSDYEVKVIGLMNYSITGMYAAKSRYRKYLNCFTEILYHFTNDSTFSELHKMPTPQLIVSDGYKIEYLDYSATIELLNR